MCQALCIHGKPSYNSGWKHALKNTRKDVVSLLSPLPLCLKPILLRCLTPPTTQIALDLVTILT